MSWLSKLWSGKKTAPETQKYCRTSLFCTASFENEQEREKHEQNCHVTND